MTESERLARGWPSFARVPLMVQQAPGVWVRAVHVAPSVSVDPVEMFLNPREGIEKFVGQVVAAKASEAVAEMVASGFPVPRIGVPLDEMAQLAADESKAIRCCQIEGAGFYRARDGGGGSLMRCCNCHAPMKTSGGAQQPWTGADGGLDDMGRRWPLDDHHGDGA